MAVITRWSYKRGCRKAGFHCTTFYKPAIRSIKSIPTFRCPQEVLKFRKFSHASDVWAFGITVLELFSYGMEPWPGLNGAEVSRGSKQGLLSMQVHSIGESLFTLFASLTYAYHFLVTLIT